MPRKTFTAGEVLTANNVNQYLYNSPEITASTATAYTIGTADINHTLQFTAATNATVTLSTASAFSAGELVNILRDGAGTVVVTKGAGVTLNGRGTAATNYAIGTQYDMATIQCVASNSYRIIGNVTAS